jgi:alpha-glucosidase
MRTKRAILLMLAVAGLCAVAASAQTNYELVSPDKNVEIKVHVGQRITYDVSYKGRALLAGSSLSMNVDHQTLGENPKVTAKKERSEDRMLEPVVKQKFAKIHEAYNELRLEMEGGYAVTFRAYDEGAAYRFETSLQEKEVTVYGEEAKFNFATDDTVFYPKEDSFMSHNERKFLPHLMSGLTNSDIASMPAVVDVGEGVKVAIAESDLADYPGLWLKGTSGPALAATFPAYPLKEVLAGDRNLNVTERADYIAKTGGTRTFPWRVLGIVANDGELLTNQIVWLLERPSELKDTSWIKPGKVAWDWWNDTNLYGVDFKSGVNTETYKYYIDFAASHGLQYIVLDEGWYKLGNVMDTVPEVNMDELAAYAKEKRVGIILWVVWKSLQDQMIPALDRFEKWGVKGIKVDFMQRDDQPLIDFYAKLCQEAANRKMMVDFHGQQKPALMTRTWPNLISTEGVEGMEWSKWSASTDPEHDVTIPFTRMFLGPMDYTPGAMLNATKSDFTPVFDRPMSQGTRCHQLAMYVVYESPLQMLADSPSNYLREPQMMEFLSPVPTVWDETKVLDAKLGDYVLMARRNGKDWYVGAMTDWSARDLDVDLSFLPAGNFKMTAYADGINADRMASDYKQTKTEVNSGTRLHIHLAPGGGWAAHIQP